MAFWVYILASDRNGTLYTGYTDELARRVWQHREELRRGFTSKYGVKKLVWIEAHSSRESAKMRERQIKKWNRAWKLSLIEERNPKWDDLYLTMNDWYSPHLRLQMFSAALSSAFPAKAGTQTRAQARKQPSEDKRTACAGWMPACAGNAVESSGSQTRKTQSSPTPAQPSPAAPSPPAAT